MRLRASTLGPPPPSSSSQPQPQKVERRSVDPLPRMGRQHFGALWTSLKFIFCGGNPEDTDTMDAIYTVGNLLEMIGEANRTLRHKHCTSLESGSSSRKEKCHDKNGNAEDQYLQQQSVENSEADENKNAEVITDELSAAAAVEELSDWSIGVEQWVATVLAQKKLAEFFESRPDLSEAIAAYRENKRAPRQEV